MKIPLFLEKIFAFYRKSISNKSVGKTLVIIVLIKLFIMFVVLRIFFFPNFLNANFKDDNSRANHVRQELIDKKVS